MLFVVINPQNNFQVICQFGVYRVCLFFWHCGVVAMKMVLRLLNSSFNPLMNFSPQRTFTIRTFMETFISPDKMHCTGLCP